MDAVRKHRQLKEVMRDVYRMGTHISTFNIPQSEELLAELRDTLFEDQNKAKQQGNLDLASQLSEDYA